MKKFVEILSLVLFMIVVGIPLYLIAFVLLFPLYPVLIFLIFAYGIVSTVKSINEDKDED